jgi:hypothetical protein
MVWSLRSRMSSVARSNTLSSTAVSCMMPSFFKRVRSSFSILLRSSGDLPNSERAVPLNLDSNVLCRHNSCLLRKPYSPSRLSSSRRISIRHGKRGASYFFLCFLGSPMLPTHRSHSRFNFHSYGFSFSPCCLGSLSTHLESVGVAVASPGLHFFHLIYVRFCP